MEALTLRRRTELQRRVPLVNRTSMRRTQLVRRAPLERGAAELRRTPLERVTPMKRGRVEAKLSKPQHDALAGRSGGICELQTVVCRYRALDPCHRLGEGMGGRYGEAAERNDRLSNVLHGCRWCHDWCHMNRAAAERERFMLRTGDDPATTPVHYRRIRWVLLNDDGGMEQCAAPTDYVELPERAS